MNTASPQLLKDAGILAEALGRQIWICQSGPQVFLSLAVVRGSTLVARVFGQDDYLMEDTE